MILNIFEETIIDLTDLVNPDLIRFLDGRSIMLLLDAYLKNNNYQLDDKGRVNIDGLLADLRFSNKGKADLRPSYTKGVGRTDYNFVKHDIDLFFIVYKEGSILRLQPYMPSYNQEIHKCLEES